MTDEQIESLCLNAGDKIKINFTDKSSASAIFGGINKRSHVTMIYYYPIKNGLMDFNYIRDIEKIEKINKENYWRKVWQFLKKHWTNMVNSLRK